MTSWTEKYLIWSASSLLFLSRLGFGCLYLGKKRIPLLVEFGNYVFYDGNYGYYDGGCCCCYCSDEVDRLLEVKPDSRVLRQRFSLSSCRHEHCWKWLWILVLPLDYSRPIPQILVIVFLYFPTQKKKKREICSSSNFKNAECGNVFGNGIIGQSLKLSFSRWKIVWNEANFEIIPTIQDESRFEIRECFPNRYCSYHCHCRVLNLIRGEAKI